MAYSSLATIMQEVRLLIYFHITSFTVKYVFFCFIRDFYTEKNKVHAEICQLKHDITEISDQEHTCTRECTLYSTMFLMSYFTSARLTRSSVE